MTENRSPWIHQLNRKRPVVALDAHHAADLAIVGGGIAGVATAYFALRDTKESVIMLEADKVAHGATGHNAGQVASYFERPLSSIAEEHGAEAAGEAQRAVESAWLLIDEILAETRLTTPVHRFTGYAGLSTLEHVIGRLNDNRVRAKGGLAPEILTVAEEWAGRSEIPGEYENEYSVVPHKDILALLDASNPDFIAALAYQKGCTNSALLSEEIVAYLLAAYPDRFTLREGSPVKEVRLSAADAKLVIGEHQVTVNRVVLATNGFENFHIIHESGPQIDTTFHHMVTGRIGYMAGYLEPLSNPPTAISYFPKSSSMTGDPTGESYFYLTRRPHETEGVPSTNLVCVGGPDTPLPNQALYNRDEVSQEHIPGVIDQFMRENYRLYPVDKPDYAYLWNGLMAYTPGGLRRVGPEPLNPRLLYNLGCNGVGILPSIWGGKRISQFLLGGAMEPSIFDPKDQRA